MFKKDHADWIRFRLLTPTPLEIDYHAEEGAYDRLDYYERMEKVYTGALKILRDSQNRGDKWVMFIHGHSTSQPGATTSRSQIRKLMRSPDATPYIIRRECIEHPTVFVAAIRPGP